MLVHIGRIYSYISEILICVKTWSPEQVRIPKLGGQVKRFCPFLNRTHHNNTVINLGMEVTDYPFN